MGGLVPEQEQQRGLAETLDSSADARPVPVRARRPTRVHAPYIYMRNTSSAEYTDEDPPTDVDG